jgi:hypothetical protein
VTVVGQAGRFAIAGVGEDGTAYIQKISGQGLEFASPSPLSFALKSNYVRLLMDSGVCPYIRAMRIWVSDREPFQSH